MENIVAAREFQVERKHVFVEFRENSRGRFLRITEEAHGRRNSVIIPDTGLAEFLNIISDVVAHGQEAGRREGE